MTIIEAIFLIFLALTVAYLSHAWSQWRDVP